VLRPLGYHERVRLDDPTQDPPLLLLRPHRSDLRPWQRVTGIVTGAVTTGHRSAMRFEILPTGSVLARRLDSQQWALLSAAQPLALFLISCVST
jgi:hypothetical protein